MFGCFKDGGRMCVGYEGSVWGWLLDVLFVV